MMNKKHLFVADIDGTLLKTNMPMNQDVINAAENYIRKGGKTSLCTGRAIASTRAIANLIHVNTPCILFGGSVIYDFKKNLVIWKQSLPDDVMYLLHSIYDRFPAVSIQAYALNDIYVLRENRRMRERGILEECSEPICGFEKCVEPLLKIVLTCDNPELLNRLINEHMYFGSFEFAFASRCFVEITPKDVSKGKTLEILSETCGIPLDRIFAAGNAMTDKSLLETAGISFATIDAPDKVKLNCNYVIPTPEDSGMKIAYDIASTYRFNYSL